jgi:hypothetical protein
VTKRSHAAGAEDKKEAHARQGKNSNFSHQHQLKGVDKQGQ